MNTKNALDYIRYISEKLHTYYADNVLCQQYAWWLLQAVCKKTQSQLIAQKDLAIDIEQQKQVEKWIAELVEHKKPIQYIFGSVPFDDLTILVEPPTLIPRPETEEWCYYLIKTLKQLKNQHLSILDIATGSGCIGLTLAHHFPQAHIIATDIADAALSLAEKNKTHNALHNITFVKSDVYDALPKAACFDLIVSNPPYISYAEKSSLDASVIEWEDPQALFADDNGLSIIKKIITAAPSFIKPNEEMKRKNIAQVMIEIGYNQGNIASQLMKNANYNDVTIYKDLEKKDRIVMGRVDNVATTNA